MMDYLSVHQYLQPEVNSRHHNYDISLRSIHFYQFFHVTHCQKANKEKFYQGFLTPCIYKKETGFQNISCCS